MSIYFHKFIVRPSLHQGTQREGKATIVKYGSAGTPPQFRETLIFYLRLYQPETRYIIPRQRKEIWKISEWLIKTLETILYIKHLKTQIKMHEHINILPPK